jgi:hypothetical protein
MGWTRDGRDGFNLKKKLFWDGRKKIILKIDNLGWYGYGMDTGWIWDGRDGSNLKKKTVWDG